MRKIVVAVICIGIAVLKHSPQGVSADGSKQDNIDIYILVDESASLSASDIKREQEAVEGIIGLELLKKRGIQVGIVPFSSGSGSPRKLEGCKLIPIDDGNDRILKDCAKTIQRQFNESGNTDFAAAFEYVSELVRVSNDPTRTSSIILMTDGIYDPDGDDKLSEEEAKKLADALDGLNKSNISIWSLGFGAADETKLKEYSQKASPRINTNCDDVKPNARIVELADLTFQLQAIAGEATCITVDPPQLIPSERFIHPLISTVIVKVVTSDGREPTLITTSGGDPCSDSWIEFVDGVFQCLASPSASDTDYWTVTEPLGSRASWQLLGDVVINFDQCPAPTILTLARADGGNINFAGATLWPEVQFDLTDKVGDVVSSLGVKVADKSSVNLDEINSKLKSSDKKYTLRASLQTTKGVPRLNAKPATCRLDTPVPATTTTSSTTTTTAPPPPCTPGIDCPPPPPPWALIIFLSLLPLIGIFAYKYWKKSRNFPEGTVFEQQSPLVANSWINQQDISGTHIFALNIGSGDMLSIEPYGTEASYIVRYKGDQVQIEFGGIDDDENKSKNSTKLEPFGLPIRLEKPSNDGFITIRIVKPSDDEDGAGDF